MNLLKIFSFLIIFSILLQPLGFVSPVFAETVEMEYPAPTDSDPKHIHAPKVVNGVTYKYDANGNLVSDGERVISWNQDNLPIRIEKDGKITEFFYDANGRRILKRSGQQTLTYVNERYQSSMDSEGNFSATKYYFTNGRTAQLVDDNLTYLHTDHLGSTVLATDSNSQKLTEPLSYFPYGRSIFNFQLPISNYQFTGQELDPESDLYNYNARLYNPETGAFISADSVQGPNRYAYAANNPMMYVDPTGNDPQSLGEWIDSFVADDTGNLTPGWEWLNYTKLINPFFYFDKFIEKPIAEEYNISASLTIGTVGTLGALAYGGAQWLSLAKDYTYYNHFYSERTLPPLRAPVGDVMWMESATGETLSLAMSEEAWEEVYQASKMMVEEYGVEVTELSRSQYEILNKLGNKPPGGEAAYVPLTGGPGWIFVVENPARLRTLYLGHEFKHFQSHWSMGFPVGGLGTLEAVSEVDAYRFIFANRAYLTSGETKSILEVFNALFGLD